MSNLIPNAFSRRILNTYIIYYFKILTKKKIYISSLCQSLLNKLSFVISQKIKKNLSFVSTCGNQTDRSGWVRFGIRSVWLWKIVGSCIELGRVRVESNFELFNTELFFWFESVRVSDCPASNHFWVLDRFGSALVMFWVVLLQVVRGWVWFGSSRVQVNRFHVNS